MGSVFHLWKLTSIFFVEFKKLLFVFMYIGVDVKRSVALSKKRKRIK